MIKICITIDDIIRDKKSKIEEYIKKNINPDFDIAQVDFSSKEAPYKLWGFKTPSEYQKFLYEDYAFEIFGSADVAENSIGNKLNLWHIELNDNEEINEELELMLANPMEFNNSIGFTYFFLSKIGTRIREVYLPKNSITIWDKCDVLITSDSNLLEKQPNGKVAVKINRDFNKDIPTPNGGSFDNLGDFIADKNNLLNVIRLLDDGCNVTLF